jgi:hypothetical protein
MTSCSGGASLRPSRTERADELVMSVGRCRAGLLGPACAGLVVTGWLRA